MATKLSGYGLVATDGVEEEKPNTAGKSFNNKLSYKLMEKLLSASLSLTPDQLAHYILL